MFLRLLAATHKKYIELNNPMFILCVYGVCIQKTRNLLQHAHTHRALLSTHSLMFSILVYFVKETAY